MTALITGNLPLVAGAPHGVKKLRELILELAVRGRLVTQHAIDVSAAELLTRIAAEKLSMEKPGKAKRAAEHTRPPLAGPFELPASWQWARLSDVTLKITDGTHRSPPNIAAGDFKYISAKNIKPWGIDLSDLTYVTAAVHDEIFSRCDPALGDVLYIKDGATTGIATLNTLNEPFSMLSSVALIKPSCGIVNAYLLKAMVAPLFYRAMRAGMTGVAITRVTLAKLNESLIPLPPLSEQHRIVAKIDELMALCDRLEAGQADAEAAHAKLVQALLASLTQARDAADFRVSWQRLAEHFHTLFTTADSIDALKKTVMQLGVEGRLCTSAARSAWRLRTINEFCTVQGGIQKTPLRAPVRRHFPYLRVANVQRGRIDIAQLERYELTPEELQRWRLNAGDLLIVEGNGSESEIGRCAIWHGEVDDCVYQNHLMRVRPTGEDAVEYLALYLNSPVGTAHMRRLAITTSGLFNLSVGKIRSIPVELPPPAEQHRIVAKVGELLTLCDQLKVSLSQARQRHEKLASVLVEQAVA